MFNPGVRAELNDIQTKVSSVAVIVDFKDLSSRRFHIWLDKMQSSTTVSSYLAKTQTPSHGRGRVVPVRNGKK